MIKEVEAHITWIGSLIVIGGLIIISFFVIPLALNIDYNKDYNIIVGLFFFVFGFFMVLLGIKKLIEDII